MLFRSVNTLFFTLATLQAVSAQGSCNNSPALCSRQYNNITHLGAHDSPFLRDASTRYSTSGNQYYNSSVQLSAGVRMLTAQIQHPNDTSTDLHVCHSSCTLLDAGTLSSWLSEVKTWLDSNPNDVVTILLVNGAGASASELASAYSASGMSAYTYTPASTTVTSVWPTLQSLISNGTRALTFVDSLGDNSAEPYLMKEFTYMFENSYNNNLPTDFSCNVSRPTNLATSDAITGGYMSLVNHFLYQNQLFGIQSPNDTYANVTNSLNGGVGSLGSHAETCETEYGKAPTFLVVDFFNVGPAIATVDKLNGVSSPVGRASVSTIAPDESAGAIALPSLSTVCLGLSTTLLLMMML